MELGRKRLGWLCGVTVLWATMAWAETSDGGTTTAVCARKREVALRWLEERKTAPAARALEQAFAECGEGHGLLSALGLAQRTPDAAADFYVRELSAPGATRDAFHGVLDVFPQVSGATRARIAKLGSAAATPLYLPNSILVGVWVDGVVCRNKPVQTLFTRWDDSFKGFVLEAECPAGALQKVYMRYPDEGRSPVVKYGRAVDRVIASAKLGMKFGANTPAELKARVDLPLEANSSLSWLLGWLHDSPRRQVVASLLLKNDPSDLDAIATLGETQLALGDPAGAMKTLAAQDPKGVAYRDSRVSGSVSGLFTSQCRILMRQKKLKEARQACQRSLDLGSRKNGPAAMAELLYLEGNASEALPLIEASLKANEQNRRGRLVMGLISLALERPREAEKHFALSMGLQTALGVAFTDKRTPDQWIALLDKFDDREQAYDLATCGHVYLDLDMAAPSKGCFAAAARIDPFTVKVRQVEHEVELNARAALPAALKLLDEARDAQVLLLVADAYVRLGERSRAHAHLKEALSRRPHWDLPPDLVETICGAQPLGACMKAPPAP